MEKLATELKPFDVVDFGGGQKGLVLPATAEALQRANANMNIAHGNALDMDNDDGDYDDFFSNPLGRRAIAAGSVTRSNPFSLNFFNDDINVVDGIPDDPISSMTLANRYFREDPIAGRVIELMAQFSVAGIRFQLKDEKIKQFYEDWSIIVGLNQVLKQIFLDYYLSGNVYVMKTLVMPEIPDGDDSFKYKVDPSLQKMTKAALRTIGNLQNEYREHFEAYMNDKISLEKMQDIKLATKVAIQEAKYGAKGAKKHIWSKSMIPGAFTILDPKVIEMKGPETFGLASMQYKISNDLKTAITSPSKEQKAMIVNLPKDFVSQIKNGKAVILDPNIVSRITRMKPDYEAMAYPLMHRAFRALHMKNRLREMDSAAIDTVITQMVIVKVGSDKYPAKPSHMQALTKAWIDAMRSKTLTLFWNHTISVERVECQIEILNQDKYEVWNNDIRDAFGISPILLGRVEGSSTTGYVSVKGFIENLEQGRQDILEQFVYPEFHGIANAMGFPGYPEVIFDKFNLQDEAAVKSLLIKLVQNGVLSYETVIEELGYSFKQEIERMGKEAPLKDDGTIRIMSPNTAGTDNQDGGRPSGEVVTNPPKKEVTRQNKDATANPPAKKT